MLFALFFGAGNLIFPAAMGQASGTNVWPAVIGFCITGVGLPLLVVASLGYSGCRDLQEVASRVHPIYGLLYTIVAYCAIGPCFAIPRTGTVSFEIAIRPFLGTEVSSLALPLFLAVFFAITYWFSATPSKLVDRIGKILTPALLAVILLLIVKSFMTPLGVPQAPTENYAEPVRAAFQGILDGYNTLDGIAAMVFATLVISLVKEDGITEPSAITRAVVKSGVIAVALLAFVYVFIARIGADSVQQLGMLDTGAPVLAGSAKILFGNEGAMILAVIVLLACLSTSIGLVTCCAGYFLKLTGKLSYKIWAALFCVISFLIGLFGLKTIIVSTIPVLMLIYPLIIALVCLIFLHKLFDGRQCVYAWTMAFTMVMAVVSFFETAGVKMDALGAVLKAYVPLHTLGLGWIPFACVGFAIGLVWKAAFPVKEKKEA